MSDTPERKKLTLKPRPAERKTDDTAPRLRSGSRAHQVAKSAVRERALAPEPPPREPAARPRADAPRPQRDRAAFADRARTDRPRTERPQADRPRRDNRPRPVPADAPREAFAAPAGEATVTRGARHRRIAAHETYAAFAPCPQGLEAALADELTALGFADVAAGRAGCRFTTDWHGVLRANLHSRLATRILVQVAHAAVANEDDLLALAQDTPWERWFGPDDTLRVDTSAVRSPMQSLQYCTLRAKDGICDRLREVEGARPSIDTVRPDARVHVFLDERTATLYLDTSGESLFKRGWRLDKGEAPLRENLAAGMLALAGWTGEAPLLDPFCGSGTLLIEAAYIALGVPPGISRPFAFERLRNHDAALWHAMKDEARTRIRARLEIPLIGGDVDARAITAARANAERAGLTPDAIEFEVRDAREQRPPEGQPGWIVTNPPYGERLAGDDEALWQGFAQTLKAHFGGWQVHVITTDRDLPRHMRLTAQRRTPLYNGALDCRLFAFEVVAGSYRQRI